MFRRVTYIDPTLKNKNVLNDSLLLPTILDPFKDNSCIAYYKFENNVDDSSGNNYHGTWSGTAIYEQNGLHGRCVKLDGNSYIDFSTIPYNITTEYSWSCWVNRATTNSLGTIAFNGRNETSDNSENDKKNGNLMFYPDEITLRHTAKGSENLEQIIYSIQFNIELNKWYHFVYTIKNNVHKVYINSNEIEELRIITKGDVTLHENIGFLFGVHHYGSTYNVYGTGLRDQIRVFNRCLTDKEIKFLYRMEKLNLS